MTNSGVIKKLSEQQENSIARLLNGKVQPNSGGTRFGGGDVLTKEFLIEAKTTVKHKDSFGIRLEWLNKAYKQSYEQNKKYYALAFRFDPDDADFFVIDSKLMKKLVEYIEEDNKYE